jgi:hypothetical protein
MKFQLRTMASRTNDSSGVGVLVENLRLAAVFERK